MTGVAARYVTFSRFAPRRHDLPKHSPGLSVVQIDALL
eukprot:CAMPEP_0113904502 /NCGR_PEP_ID=MMETSP0780_2-20120614/23299_1 /TAXON_ID=652834 /ORGANISM="Palpitomonas bilix" /LENGTH=37 /DNA_ID=CAMNT_0000898141 /DNA_START=82 /DNA_END=195 /DNA_ORIENTATION=- /assembly_acc=CAM_ASM_000599